jgi:hypothetical protein
MVTPRMRQRPPEGVPWAADNGRFSAPEDYTDEGYLAWLRKMPGGCLFACAPDVLGDAEATLALSAPMLPRIRAIVPVALVAQDGLTPDMVPWDDIDALFIGGTTAWKLGPDVPVLVAEAKRRGKWAHMGRVNSWKRYDYARAIGCDSVDGTVLKHDPKRPVREWMDRAWREPHIWEAGGGLA